MSPPSKCPGCDEFIKPRDNVPVISWLLLRGQCRNCGQPISARYPLVEMLTAVVFAAMAAHFGFDWQLPAYLYFAAIGLALAAIDLDTKRLPNVLTLPSYAVALVLLLIPTVLDNRWPDFVRALAGAAILFGLYFVLAMIYPAGMGFGDVKLAGLLGIYLGWLGWSSLIIGGFLGFLLGGVVGLALMALKKAGRKSAIPFGPFMVAGAFAAVFIAEPLSAWYLGAIGA